MELSPSLPLMERVAMLHHRLVAIHPFVNGNGRHARLITDIYLLNENGKLPKWPVLLHETKNAFRKEYLEALRHADKGSYVALLKLLKKVSSY